MSERQVEASMASRRRALYQQIATVFDVLPDRFTPAELYARARLKHHRQPQYRMLVASVLVHDFQCDQLAEKKLRLWRKRPAQL